MRLKFPLFGKKSIQVYPFFDLNNLSALDGNSMRADTTSVTGQMDAYMKCAPVAAIIQRLASAMATGKRFLLDKDGNEVVNSQAQKLNALLNRPNPIQTWAIFIQQLYTFYSLHGECFIYGLIPSGFEGQKDRIKALYIIPNNQITPVYTGKYIYQTERDQIVSSYIINTQGEQIECKPSEILHIQSPCPNLTDPLRGNSKLTSLEDQVTNIIAAYKKRNILIEYPVGILSNAGKDVSGTIPLQKGEKEELQADLKWYSIKRRRQIVVTNAALSWQTMLPNIGQLMLFEEIEDDVARICDAYGYPKYLLGFTGGTTFSNVNEAGKKLYQDTIIPESELIMEAVSNYLETFKITPPCRYILDYSHVEPLQESEQEKATAKKTIIEAANVAYSNGMITFEEMRIMIDMDETINGQLKNEQTANN